MAVRAFDKTRGLPQDDRWRSRHHPTFRPKSGISADCARMKQNPSSPLSLPPLLESHFSSFATPTEIDSSIVKVATLRTVTHYSGFF
jgi:hypothetical protein